MIAVLSRRYGYTVPSNEVARFLAAGFTPGRCEMLVHVATAGRRRPDPHGERT